MKIAVLADIHGNLPALEAVIANLTTETPDLVVNLGDCVSGPLWPQETGELLMDLEWPTVRGNHDRVASGAPVPPENRTDHFTQAEISPAVATWLRDLPGILQVPPDITAFHATPGVDTLYLTEEVANGRAHLASQSVIQERLGAPAPGELLLCGHTHIPRLLSLSGGITIFNPGSVGCPAYTDDEPEHHVMETGSPHARYGLMQLRNGTWDFWHKTIDYDWDHAAARAASVGRPDWAAMLATGHAVKSS